MFAGKTEELIRRARRALYAGRVVQVFKPRFDDRFHTSMVVTHMGVSHEAIPVGSIAEIIARVNPKVQSVLIEEAQFFDPSITEFSVALADAGCEVTLAGLDQDFRRMPFGPMAALMAAADEVVKLRAICMKCGAPASHTYRSVNGKPAHEDDPIILIGAAENYEARCRRCYRLGRTRRRGQN